MNRLRLSAELAHLPAGNISYCHSNRGCASSAFELKEKKAEISLRSPRALGFSEIYLELYREDLSSLITIAEGEWECFDSDIDTYKFFIDLSKIGIGLYFFRFKAVSCGATVYGHKFSDTIYFNSDAGMNDLCQLTIASFKHKRPDKIYGGVIYHIFVDRFNRGCGAPVSDGAVLVSGEWTEIPEYPEYPGAHLKNNTFYGGTLWGIADKLDYISSLGVTAIYLSPIFKSVSNHKYDTADYLSVDEMFGGDQALAHLIKECDKRNIALILDGVFNHTGDDSVYFNRYGRFNSLGAYQSKQSPYFSWYNFQKHPDKYTCWWDIEILPRINPDVSQCREFFVGDDGVLEKYRNMGIYGLRLDVADELSDDFLSEIKNKLSDDGESIVYGEVWEDASNKISYGNRKKYYLGRELDGVMNYPLRSGIIDFVMHRGLERLKYALTDITVNAPDRILHAQMNLLGTHDTERIITILGGEPSDGYTNAQLSKKRIAEADRDIAIKRTAMAYTVLATLPGVPAVFYGDEAGLEGYHDPFNRMPFPWGKEAPALVKHYTQIGSIRRKNGVYKRGGFKLCVLEPDLLVFARTTDKYSYITVCNNSNKSIQISFTNEAEALVNSKKTKEYTLSSISSEIFKTYVDTEVEIS